MVENEHTDQDSHDDDHGHDDHGHGGLGVYIAVFVALCVLTFFSFIIGNYMRGTPTIAWTGMMAVSCAKALLVILFFMHLKWEANWKYVLTIPASIMSLFLLLMLIPDVGRRTDRYSQTRWNFAATPQVGHDEHGDRHGDKHHDHDKKHGNKEHGDGDHKDDHDHDKKHSG